MRSTPELRPFVGREAELQVLLDAVSAAEAGRGSLVLLAGEAGIGKTRLAEEAAAQAARHGALVLWGRAGETGAAPPFWPWLQTIRSYLAALNDDERKARLTELRSLAQLLPELREFFPAGIPVPAPADEGMRTRVFEAVFAILRQAAKRQPLIVILDDLHDMDASSLLLLRHVAGDLPDSRLLVMGAYRSDELKAGSVGRSVIREVLRQPHAREVLLHGLGAQEVENYIRRTTGEAPSPTLIGRLVEETDGNALFVTELVRHLDLEGGLSAQGGTIARLALPETVREVIGERIVGLPKGCQDLLQSASVLGRRFELAVLERLAEQPAEEVIDQLDNALDAALLVATEGPLAYQFSHGVIREVIYDAVPRRRRMELHSRAADVLEAMAGVLIDERASEIAHHLLAAGTLVSAPRAVRFAELAGEHALSRLAYEEAARLFTAGLAMLTGAPDDRRRAELLLGLGDALARSGDAAAAKDRFFQAATLARRLGLPEHLARAALGYGGRFVWEASRGDPHLTTLLNDALVHMEDRRDALHARLLARLAAGPLRDDPDRTRREQLSAEAVKIAEALGDLPTLAYVLDGRFAAIWGPEALDERMATARKLIDISRQVGDRERELQGHHYLCLASLEAGDLGGAEREATEQRVLAGILKQPAQLLYSMTVDTTLAVLQGRYDEAAALIPQATAVGQRAEQAMSVIYSLFERYMIARDQGNAESLLDELLAAAARFPTYTVVQALIADAYTQAGRHADARAALRRLAASDFTEIPRNDEWLFAMTILADVACELAEALPAAVLYDLLLPFEDRVAVSAPDACTGAVARVLGRIGALLPDRHAAAQAHLERAVEINARLSARAWLARTRFHLGELLLGSGSHDRAGELLEACVREAEDLGMSWLAAAARGLLPARATSQEVRRTFLFSDVVRSTELVSAIGDEAWENVVHWHDNALRELFAAHSGEEIDHPGDGFFVAFTSSAAAVECAIAIQRRLAEHRRLAGYAPEVRIGIHADRARTRAGGYRGSGVHRAARIGAAAAGGEILVSRSTLSAIDHPDPIEERSLQLKGFRDPVAVAVIGW